ncbi:hypothetical protein ACFQH6_10530 [Halobacteriaceae archaeon GCM10025711]
MTKTNVVGVLPVVGALVGGVAGYLTGDVAGLVIWGVVGFFAGKATQSLVRSV